MNICPRCQKEIHAFAVGLCLTCQDDDLYKIRDTQQKMQDEREARNADCDKSHGSPYQRGRADAYCGRAKAPHKWIGGESLAEVPLTDPDEITQYRMGFDSQEGMKDLGKPETTDFDDWTDV